jgi:UDP-N-acetylenolpyruvoylglucosamine reductase
VVRFRFISQVRMGHFAQALEAAEEMSAVQKARGWPEGTHWIVVGGAVNTLITEMEFSTLASEEEYEDKADADAEHTALRRKAGEHLVEGSARIELLKTAPHLPWGESVPFAVRA